MGVVYTLRTGARQTWLPFETDAITGSRIPKGRGTLAVNFHLQGLSFSTAEKDVECLYLSFQMCGQMFSIRLCGIDSPKLNIDFLLHSRYSKSVKQTSEPKPYPDDCLLRIGGLSSAMISKSGCFVHRRCVVPSARFSLSSSYYKRIANAYPWSCNSSCRCHRPRQYLSSLALWWRVLL